MNWEKKGNENKRKKRMKVREKKRINGKRRKEEKAWPDNVNKNQNFHMKQKIKFSGLMR